MSLASKTSKRSFLFRLPHALNFCTEIPKEKTSFHGYFSHSKLQKLFTFCFFNATSTLIHIERLYFLKILASLSLSVGNFLSSMSSHSSGRYRPELQIQQQIESQAECRFELLKPPELLERRKYFKLTESFSWLHCLSYVAIH